MASLIMEGLIEGGALAGAALAESAPEIGEGIGGAVEVGALGASKLKGAGDVADAAAQSEAEAAQHTAEAPVADTRSTAEKVKDYFTPEPGAKPARDVGWKQPNTPLPKIPLSEKVINTILGKDLGFAAEDEAMKDMKTLEKLQIHNTSKGIRLPNTKYLENIANSIDKDGTLSHKLEDLKLVHKPLFKSNANVVSRRVGDLLKNYPVGSKGGGNPGIKYINRLPRSILKAIDGSKILTSEEKVQLLKGQVGRNAFTATNNLVDSIIAKHSKVAEEIVEEVPKVQESIATIEKEAESEPEKFKAEIQKSVEPKKLTRVQQMAKKINMNERIEKIGDIRGIFSRKYSTALHELTEQELAKRGIQKEIVSELKVQMTTNPSPTIEAELAKAKDEAAALKTEVEKLQALSKELTENIKIEDAKVDKVISVVEDAPDTEFKEVFEKSMQKIENPETKEEVFKRLTQVQKNLLSVVNEPLSPEFQELIETTENTDLRNRLLSLVDSSESELKSPDVMRVGVDPLTEEFMSLYQRNWLDYPNIEKVLTPAERTQLNEYLLTNKLRVKDPEKFKEDFIYFINKIKSPSTKLKLYNNLTQDEKNLLGKNFFKDRMQVLVDESERLKKNISLPKTMEEPAAIISPAESFAEEGAEPLVDPLSSLDSPPVDLGKPVDPLAPESTTSKAEEEGMIGEPKEAAGDFDTPSTEEKAGFFTSEGFKTAMAGLFGGIAGSGLVVGIGAAIDKLKDGDYSDIKKAYDTFTKVATTAALLEKDLKKYVALWNGAGTNRQQAAAAQRGIQQTKNELAKLKQAEGKAGADLKKAVTKASGDIKKVATAAKKKAISDKEYSSKQAKDRVGSGLLTDTSIPSIKIYNNFQSPESFLKSEDDFSTITKKNVNSKNKTSEHTDKADHKSKIVHDGEGDPVS